MEFLVNRGYSLRQAQSDILSVILSLPRPVILSSSKDDPNEGLRIGDPVTLRQAQSDSEAQSNTRYVILSSSKDDLIDGLRICGTVPLRQAQSDSVVQSDSRAQSDSVAQSDTQYVILSSSFPVILSSSKDDTPRRLKVGDPVPLRQAQSDRKSKDDTKSQDDPQRRSKSRN